MVRRAALAYFSSASCHRSELKSPSFKGFIRGTFFRWRWPANTPLGRARYQARVAGKRSPGNRAAQLARQYMHPFAIDDLALAGRPVHDIGSHFRYGQPEAKGV